MSCFNQSTSIVGSFSLLSGVSASIPVTTIYTASDDGLYRVSLYGESAAAISLDTQTLSANLSYTDSLGTILQRFDSFPLISPVITGGSSFLVIKLSAGSIISIAGTVNSYDGITPYDLYYVIERIG